jgi:phage regulator Rha-like protein
MVDDIIPLENIESRIFLIRRHKVMLDRDLAELYEVETKHLNRQVKRNIQRFPEEFMFQLNVEERNQLVTICHRFKTMKHSSSLPYVFTEHGVAMLASVLKSDRAVKISINVIKAFIKLREILSTHKELAHKLAQLEQKIEKHDEEIKVVFDAIRKMMAPPPEPKKKKIGFVVRERSAQYRTLSRKAVKN